MVEEMVNHGIQKEMYDAINIFGGEIQHKNDTMHIKQFYTFILHKRISCPIQSFIRKIILLFLKKFT